MARQAVPRSSKSKSKRETPARPVFARPRLSWGGRKLEVAGVLIVVLAILTAVALARLAPGTVSDGWADLLIRLFGWGAYIIPVAMAIAGYKLFRHGQGTASQPDSLSKRGML